MALICADEKTALVELNKEGVLSEIARLGQGLLERIERHDV